MSRIRPLPAEQSKDATVSFDPHPQRDHQGSVRHHAGPSGGRKTSRHNVVAGTSYFRSRARGGRGDNGKHGRWVGQDALLGSQRWTSCSRSLPGRSDSCPGFSSARCCRRSYRCSSPVDIATRHPGLVRRQREKHALYGPSSQVGVSRSGSERSISFDQLLRWRRHPLLCSIP